MKFIEIVDSKQTQSASAHRKVRLKSECVNLLNRLASNIIVVVIVCSLCIISRVSCLETRNNRPPRFLIDNQHSEIVLRLKEGPDTPVGKCIIVSMFWLIFMDSTLIKKNNIFCIIQMQAV